MAALTGLTGLAGYQVQIDADAQATPEERSGGPADPRHAHRGESAPPYLWNSQTVMAGSHGPYGPENQLLGDPEWVWEPAGNEWEDPDFDHTPSTRAAPFPRGILSGPIPGETPDDVARQRKKSAAIHAVDCGASAKMQHTLEPLQDQWEGFYNVTPGHSDDVEPPNLYKSAGFGWGTTDRTQSFARQNEYGFDSAHMTRRYATGEIPGNNYWMRPGGRIMRKSMAGPARPAIGPDSPFEGNDLGRPFAVGGAILLNPPTQYVAPPQPHLAQPYVQTDASDAVVEWY